MARPLKPGLEYYPHDVNMSQDPKIEFIESKFGLIGYAVVNKLLEIIYRNGYYCDWNEKAATVFASKNHLDIAQVNAIVETCLDEQVFSPPMFKTYGILTSPGIQKRYIWATNKRSNVIITREYDLIGHNLPGNDGSEDVSGAGSTQSKVKDSIVQESKVQHHEDIHIEIRTERPMPKDLEARKINIDEFLLLWWGKAGRQSYALMVDFVNLKTKYGYTALGEAIIKAAHANACSYRYVEAILRPKTDERPQSREPRTGPMILGDAVATPLQLQSHAVKTPQCDMPGHENMEWKDGMCLLCFPVCKECGQRHTPDMNCEQHKSFSLKQQKAT
jgi:hypothetical protein